MIPPELAAATECRRRGDLAAAKEICDQILGKSSNQPETLNLRAMIAHDLGRSDEAIRDLCSAVRVSPQNATFHYNLGTLYYAIGQLEEAVTCFRQALGLRPGFPQALGNLGNTLRRLGDYDAALDVFQQLQQLRPNAAESHNNLGTIYFKQGRFREALESIDRSLSLKPDHAEAKYNRALVSLLTGNLEVGWNDYEWRWRRKGHALPHFPQPQWDGSPLEGKKILLYSEQGLGDTLQFIRYAPLVQERGGDVILACQRPLLKLLARSPGINQLVALDSAGSDFAVQAPLMSLPRLFRTSLNTVPAIVPYIHPDPQLVAAWHKKLENFRAFKIGIVWQGNPLHEDNRQRSVPFYHFIGVARLPGVHVFSLQNDPRDEQLQAMSSGSDARVTDLGSHIDQGESAFVDTAAILKHLDLVITVDTAVAHLAGAMGVPAWVALPFVPDWRWLLNRDDSPWYPTIRLFRQAQTGDWTPVFERITKELQNLISITKSISGI